MNIIRSIAVFLMALVMPLAAQAHVDNPQVSGALPPGAEPRMEVINTPLALKSAGDCHQLFTPGYEMDQREMAAGRAAVATFGKNYVTSLACWRVFIIRDLETPIPPPLDVLCAPACKNMRELGVAVMEMNYGPGSCTLDGPFGELAKTGCIRGLVNGYTKVALWFNPSPDWIEQNVPIMGKCSRDTPWFVESVLHELQHAFTDYTHGYMRDDPESVVFYQVLDGLVKQAHDEHPDLPRLPECV